MARYLEIESWPRRATFEFYRGFDKPYFNVCTRLDMTRLKALPSLQGDGRLSLAYHHLVLQAAHRIEPFRYRLEGGRVRVHDRVDGSMTVLGDDDSIRFVTLPFRPAFRDFAAGCAPVVHDARRAILPFEPDVDRQDLLHFTTLPWFDFSSFSHARNWGREDAVPKFAFGRICRDGDRWSMAMSVEVHHALMDGLHVGRLVQAIEQGLLDPEPVYGSV